MQVYIYIIFSYVFFQYSLHKEVTKWMRHLELNA